jgi:hypothetical protein
MELPRPGPAQDRRRVVPAVDAEFGNDGSGREAIEEVQPVGKNPGISEVPVVELHDGHRVGFAPPLAILAGESGPETIAEERSQHPHSRSTRFIRA